MRDVGPEGLVAGPEIDRGTEALALHLHPDLAEPLGGQLAVAPLGVDLALECVERDLAHDRVDHVLDLGGEHGLALLCGRRPARSFLKVSISPNTLAVSASVSGVGAISGPFGAAST